MGAVIGPAAARLHEFAGRDQRCMADDRHRLTMAARLDLEHAEAALGVVKHNPLDEPGEDFAVLARLRCCPCHPRMMASTEAGRQRTARRAAARLSQN
jgi:hypothetical protein